MPHNKEIEEIANHYRERIKDEAFYKTDTGHALDLTMTRQILITALTSYGKSQYDKGVEEGLSMMSKFLVASIDKYNK